MFLVVFLIVYVFFKFICNVFCNILLFFSFLYRFCISVRCSSGLFVCVFDLLIDWFSLISFGLISCIVGVRFRRSLVLYFGSRLVTMNME